MTVKPPSPKWIAQVLRDRGFPAPTVPAIERAASAWNAEQADAAFKLLKRMESATDTPRDYKAVEELLAVEPPPAIATPEQKTKPPTRSRAEPAQDPEERAKHHIYASKSAITVELVAVRGERQERARKSIMIEAAQGEGNRAYDWERKIYFSVMLRELPLVAAALLGLLGKPLVLANHGENTDKRLEIHGSSDRVVLKVFQGKRAIVVPALAYDCFAALDIALKALTMNSPHLAGDLLHTMLRRAAQMHNETKKE